MSASELGRTPERPFPRESRMMQDPRARTLHDLLIDSATESAIFALDAEGHVATWNAGAQRLKGYLADEIIGRHFSAFYTDDDRRAGLPEIVLAAAAETGRFEGEGWRVRKDGSRFWGNVVVTPIRAPGGALLGFAKITRDLTERREAELRQIELAAERGARAEAERRNSELIRLSEQLQDQAVELEAQNEEAQALTEELEQANEELQKALARTEAAEANTRRILDSIAEPFVVHDADWRFRYVNAAAARIFAVSTRASAGDIVGRVVWDVYPELVGTTFEREMRRAAAERIPVTCEAYYRERDEWSQLFCYPLPDGGLATQWTNITARKREAARLARLQRATAALSGATTPDAVARVILTEGMAAMDASAGIVFLLDEGGEHLVQIGSEGYDPTVLADWRRVPISVDAGIAEVVRTRTPVWLPDPAARARKYPHLMQSRTTTPFGAWCMLPMLVGDRAIGSLTFAFASPRPFETDDARLLETFAAQAAQALDRARLYEFEQRARSVAEAANRAKADFLATMSHELRTPLNAVIGYAQLLEEELRGPLTPEQRHDVSRIRGAARHVLSLINAVLDQARIEAGEIQLQLEDIPVQDLLDAVESFIAPQLGAKGLAYRCEACGPDLAVRADREKTLQILLNLASNAVKFTDCGGLTLSARDDGTHAVIQVADTGRGIPGPELVRIFEPFVQVKMPMASPREGTGLGLAISRQLARRMGGDLRVESTVGAGSTFTLLLPRAGLTSIGTA